MCANVSANKREGDGESDGERDIEESKKKIGRARKNVCVMHTNK